MRLITQADVGGMSRVFDERATLIAALPDTLPESSGDSLTRALSSLAANN